MGTVFDSHPLLIARMDQLARNEDLQAELERSDWDLVVVDEVHRMGAHYFGGKLEKTKRFQLGELLGRLTRHLLLMTATPHAGKEEDFQLFLTLLDRDRFEGRYAPGVHTTDTTDVMRRMVKEDLLTFEGTSLFPKRIAETVPYELTPPEQELYDEVTTYVREGMNRAQQLDGKRRNTVGFALDATDRRGTASRTYRNMLVYLAADETRLNELESAVRTYLGWSDVVSSHDLDLTENQKNQAIEKQRDAEVTVKSRLLAIYQWALVTDGQPVTLNETVSPQREPSEGSTALSVADREGGRLLVSHHETPVSDASSAAGPTGFFGHTELDPSRYVVDFKKINDEALVHLAATPGVAQRVSIEIKARRSPASTPARSAPSPRTPKS